MIIEVETAMKMRQIFNALIQMKKNTSDVNTILHDLNDAMTLEEIMVFKEYLDNSINNYNKHQNDAKQNIG